MSEEFKALRREMEWNRKRHDGAQRELHKLEDLAGETIAADVVERYRRYIVELLRRHGEEALAAAITAAYERHTTAIANLERFNAAGEANEAAYTESNRAQFDLERVLADLTEWLDAHDPDSNDE